MNGRNTNTLVTEMEQDPRDTEMTTKLSGRAIMATSRKQQDGASTKSPSLARQHQKNPNTALVPRKPKPLAISEKDQKNPNTALVSRKPKPLAISEKEKGAVARLQAEFLHTCLPLFFAEHDPVHSLGFTSAVSGEGKTLTALLVSHALATNSSRPVILVECDWQRPTFSKDLGLADGPGLAEWLSGANDRDDIRQEFIPNLTVVSAGQGDAGAMTALAELQRSELYDRLADPDELMILDLPPVLGSYYGTIAARLAESLMMVVRAGSTPSSFVTQACEELKHLRVEGIILNQVKTSIPSWLQSLL